MGWPLFEEVCMPNHPAKSNGPLGDVTYNMPPASASGLSPILDRNIEALVRRRNQERQSQSWEARIADAITWFTGSMLFVYLHLAIFGLWIVVNLHWIPGIPAFDETFVILAMVASVEAIFLSTFVLITQNRMAIDADKRADLDLQISLLAEHELTKMATLLSAIADKQGVRTEVDAELEEIKKDVAPEAVLDKIESTAH
jgi:uncharacterized membrane protein